MRRLLPTFLAGVLILVFATGAGGVPGNVLRGLPAPGKNSTGLAFDGKHLWVADRLTDTLYAVDPATGKIERSLPSPGFMPRGMTWDGKYLWCVDGEEKRIIKLDLETGTTVRSFDAPTTSPMGIAWDGSALWLVDDGEDVIAQISPDDGTTIVSYAAPSGSSTGLVWWNGYLWCADRRDDRLYLFDAKHGEVVFGMDAPGKFIWGLTADGNTLWCVDYQSDSLYQLVIDDGQSVQRRNAHTLQLQLTYEFRNYGPGKVPALDVYVAVPDSLPNQTLKSSISYSPPPLDFLPDRWQQPVAHFHLTNLAPAKRERLTMVVTAELADTRWFLFPHKVGALSEIPKAIREAYLVDEDKFRLTDPIIQEASRKAVGSETNPYWMMRNIHKYVREHLTYELAGGWNVAPRVLTRGNGSCSEYTFVFIALCRAAGIPARYVGSVVVRGDEASYDEVFHRWSQVYLPNYGWTHVDPQGGDKEKPADVAESIGMVGNRFLITTQGGGASEYLGWNYNYDDAWTGQGPVKIHREAVGEWTPVVGGK